MGRHPADLAPNRIETTTPEATLDGVCSYFEERPVEALGVASFGPLDLDPSSPNYGSIVATPKPDWSGTPIRSLLMRRLGVPVEIHTDVVGAALGEGRWGAAGGCDDHAYVTVGTGVGVGMVVDGAVLGGRRHPELGHIPVRRMDGDDYPGRCPFHGSCLEGMASGPALQERFGRPGERDEDKAARTSAHYVAQVVATLIYTYAPVRIVVGGGVGSGALFHEELRTAASSLLAGYPVAEDLETVVVAPGLVGLSGLAGGLILAERALI